MPRSSTFFIRGVALVVLAGALAWGRTHAAPDLDGALASVFPEAARTEEVGGVLAVTEVVHKSLISIGFFDFLVDRAIAKGLTFRPLEETIQATMDWSLSRPNDHEWRGGLRSERETELLTEWLRRS